MRKRLLSLLLCVALLFTSVMIPALSVSAAEDDGYEIYPIPQSVDYTGDTVDVPENVNLVLTSSLDEATTKKIKTVLTDKGISYEESSAPVSGAFNVVITVNGDTVSGYTAPAANGTDYFEKTDSYILTIADKSINIVGKDTDAAFYGVVTLKWILEQCGDSIRTLRIDDYSDAEFRGFIEGYYGIPWSDADRISLMEFGGNVKMNTYVFAPKDDPYHSQRWTTLYPQDRLEEMKEMVQAGIDSKCRFVWTIHPFMYNQITASNYNERLATIKQKFEQLYSIGVRQFGILADDASSSTDIQRRLCIDMTEWCEDKGDVYDLLFCPQQYNKGWTTVTGGRAPYFDTLTQDLPESVRIFWTGNSVCAAATQDTFDWFTQMVDGREALMWINWPCNDINKLRLLMGRGELLNPGVTGFCGIVANPMQQAEPSKVALFAIADYTWNRSGWDMDKSWADSFKYVDPGASEALHTMAKHLSDPKPNGHGEVLTESEDIASLIDEFTTAYNAGNSVKDSGTRLAAEMDIIIDACNEFEENSSVPALREQMQPWTESLRDIATAIKYYVQTAIAFEDNNEDEIWANYSQAAAAYSSSQNRPVQNINSVDNVEAGAKRLIPLASSLADALAGDVLDVVNPNGAVSGSVIKPSAIIKSADFTSVYQGSEDNIYDGNANTYCWYRTSGNTVTANGYIGLDLGEPRNIGSVNIIQACSATGDSFATAILEYSVDGQTYTEIGTYTGNNINVTLTTPVTARYVRLRTPVNTGKWYSISEFTVTEYTGGVNIATVAYTNIPTLATIPVSFDLETATLSDISGEITLAPGQYIGVALERIKVIDDVIFDTTMDGLTLEYSVNGVEWYDDNTDTSVQLGDVNRDDAITSLDATVVLQYAAGIIESSDERYNYNAADVSGDGAVTSLDATYILQHAAGIITISSSASATASGNARYVRLINKTDADITGTLSGFTVHSDEILPISVVENTLGGGDPLLALDGDRNTIADFQSSQAAGKHVIYDLGQTVTIDSLNFVMYDGENDFIRNGIVSISADGETWTDVITLGNGRTDVEIGDIYTHDLSYYVAGNDDVGGIDARYIKVELTSGPGAADKWTSFSEIEINHNAYRPTTTDPTFTEAKKVEGEKIPNRLIDNDVSTTYLPETTDSSVIFNVSENTHITSITVLQSPGTVSDAVVSVRVGTNTWEKIGTLGQSLNKFEDLDYEHIFAVKFEWGKVIPELHEMFFTYADEELPNVDKSKLIQKYEDALALNQRNYTEESYAVLVKALSDADGVINYAYSTDKDVADAIAVLEAAIAQLDPRIADKTELNALIAYAQTLNQNSYMADSWSALQTALAAAQATAAKDPLYQGEADEAVAALQSVIDSMVMQGTTAKIDSSKLTGYAPSAQSGEGYANAVDGNENTQWHTEWYTPVDFDGGDNYYMITLDTNHYVNKLEYLPRSSGSNGIITEYKLYYSPTADGDDFVEINGGSGTWANSNATKTAEFTQVNARRIKIVAVSTVGDNPNYFISAREFYLYEIIPNT